jgi:hypothetical protein
MRAFKHFDGGQCKQGLISLNLTYHVEAFTLTELSQTNVNKSANQDRSPR